MTPNKDTKKSESTSIEKGGLLPVAEDVREEFLRFIAFHSAKRFSRNLRKMLLEFMTYDGALEAIYLKDLLYDMDGLFDLLDSIHETQGSFEE